MNKKNITIALIENCNLDCVYCYEHHKKDAKISLDIARQIIDNEMNSNDSSDEVIIEFFGGEPFLAFDIMKEVHDYIVENEWGKRFTIFTTTNGTLVHGEVQSWLRKNKNTFVCGLSLDGTREMHNKNRSNSFDSIDYKFFKNTWPKQTVKMTISPLTLPQLAEGVIFLHQCGFEVLCNLAYGVDWNRNRFSDILIKQLSILAEYYLENPNIKPCSMLSMPIENISRFSINRTTRKWCGAGTLMHAYDTNGQRYPCQFFMPLSIGSQKAKKALELTFKDKIDLTEIDQKCKSCSYIAACPSCLGANYLQSGSLYIKDNGYCHLTKTMFRATAYLKANQIARGTLKLCNEELYHLIRGIKAIEASQ